MIVWFQSVLAMNSDFTFTNAAGPIATLATWGHYEPHYLRRTTDPPDPWTIQAGTYSSMDFQTMSKTPLEPNDTITATFQGVLTVVQPAARIPVQCGPVTFKLS
jgi:hypothetical protein